MRIFAEPNGSGKSTIFNDINARYDVGYYINPDIIERAIKKDSSLNISLFGLTDVKSDSFSEFTSTHSLKAKAESKGYSIQASLEIILFTLKTHHNFHMRLLL